VKAPGPAAPPRAMPPVLGWLLVVLGVALIGLGLLNAAGWAAFALRAETAEAVVERIERRASNQQAPVFRFRIADGREVSARSLDAYGRARFGEGQAVRIAYDPADPSRATGDPLERLIFMPLLLVPLGAALLGIRWVLRRPAAMTPPPR